MLLLLKSPKFRIIRVLSPTLLTRSTVHNVINSDTVTMDFDKEFSIASRYYSPAVLAAFKAIRDKDMKDEHFSKLQKVAKKFILLLNRDESESKKSFADRERNRRDAGDAAVIAISSISSDKELMAVAACLAIVMPRSKEVWLHFDREISKNIDRFSLDSMTLVASVLSAAQKPRIRTDQVYIPEIVSTLILDRIHNAFSIENTAISHSVRVRDIIQLGLNLEIISKFKDSYTAELSAKDREKMSSYCKSILSSPSPLSTTTTPTLHTFQISHTSTTTTMTGMTGVTGVTGVEGMTRDYYPLHALEPLWRYIHPLNLPHSSDIHIALNRRILKSITIDPSQLKNQDMKIISLLESMKASKVKDRKIICDMISYRNKNQNDSDNQKNGIKLFSILTELDFGLQGMEILSTTLCIPKVKLPSKSNVLSIEAKTSIFNMLSNTKGVAYKSSDLIIALYAFGNDEKTSGYYRVIEGIEGEILPAVSGMDIKEVVNILNAYSYLGRKYPVIIQAINSTINKGLDLLSGSQIERILWCNAHLNNRADYNARAALMFFAHKKNNSDHYSLSRFLSIIVTLWSLSVLQELSVKNYLNMENTLTKARKFDDIGEIPHNSMQMLSQVLLEVRLKAEQNHLQHTDNAEYKRQFEAISLVRNWEEERTKVVQPSSVTSSHSHKDVSKQLIAIGYPHNNEKLIHDLYIVDIFISPAKNASNKGIILELDGPRHYENYMNTPLGPTNMKKRHLQELGYIVKTLPYWGYQVFDTDSRKRKILLDLIQKK